MATIRELSGWTGACCHITPDECWIDDRTGEHVNARTGVRTPQHAPPEPELHCVTGKRCYPSKRAARDAAGKENRRQLDRRHLNAFRCGWCEKYHLGHRR